MSTKKIGIIVGSLRKDSYCRKIARVLMQLAPASLNMEEVDISDLAMFNQDLEEQGNEPEAWIAFRKRIKEYDGFLFITPEYNRSYPAALKNALDVGSRPYGKSAWNGKPGAVVSVTPGALGAFGANHHLRQVLTFLNIPTMQQPEAYIANVATLFDDDGNINNESTREFLKGFVDSFAAWVNANSHG
ncbi:NADPH-dependent FMN reductase [Clostridium thermosuccinogenes]|uniref:NADPH-dependent FMN reductase n=1 Tax=Clostridium thermosuccinogenes TaxID=84032 RepID=A0A2K2FG12_9CLOT|nr:NAD(P)H-dependent oxidoreductase [Pseudoclostridium thermosuccinogenes]AUS97013.1 NADPH-dependent FMN reductase [Pseudoclostridium thermosuccinogenes]PNT96113.1 NADPH-dependent FMN reductase [Pseudoclostridium thermosuccinogenes]PNT97724.1 NADPH-dependent FMN reductase [Pseudoclostridium thermosuccinogenes]